MMFTSRRLFSTLQKSVNGANQHFIVTRRTPNILGSEIVRVSVIEKTNSISDVSVTEHHRNEKFIEKYSFLTKSYLGRKLLDLAVVLVPSGYPNSVHSSYSRYALWTNAAVIFSLSCSMLGTHAMFEAMGFSSSVSVPGSAVVSWLLKDGLGNLGTVLAASKLGNQFEQHPKRWRLLSSVFIDLAACIEMSTVYFPSLFVPIGGLAYTLRGVTSATASASRASLHLSLARDNNLPDITAKAAAQMTVATTLGTVCGLAATSLVTATPSLGPPFALFFFIAHIFCVNRGLRDVNVLSLSRERLSRASYPWMEYIIQQIKGGRDTHSPTLVPFFALSAAAVNSTIPILPDYSSTAGQFLKRPLLLPETELEALKELHACTAICNPLVSSYILSYQSTSTVTPPLFDRVVSGVFSRKLASQLSSLFFGNSHTPSSGPLSNEAEAIVPCLVFCEKPTTADIVKGYIHSQLFHHMLLDPVAVSGAASFVSVLLNQPADSDALDSLRMSMEHLRCIPSDSVEYKVLVCLALTRYIVDAEGDAIQKRLAEGGWDSNRVFVELDNNYRISFQVS